MLGHESLSDARTFDELHTRIVEVARSLVRSDGATFVLRDDDRCFYVAEDAIAPLWTGQRFPMTQCISGWAMLNGATAVVPDITADERIPLEAYLPTFVRSLAMVPVGTGQPIGAIGAYWAERHTATNEELGQLRELAAEVAETIERIGLAEAPWAPSFDRAVPEQQ